jgi:hypothetical protein
VIEYGVEDLSFVLYKLPLFGPSEEAPGPGLMITRLSQCLETIRCHKRIGFLEAVNNLPLIFVLSAQNASNENSS